MTVELRDARGNVLRRVVERIEVLAKALPPVEDPDFPMLGLLDPYGDTVFSSMQMRSVIPEIRRLRELSPPSAHDVLDDLEGLASECADRAHVFLVFVGD
jgi:hypothetical protein